MIGFVLFVFTNPPLTESACDEQVEARLVADCLTPNGLQYEKGYRVGVGLATRRSGDCTQDDLASVRRWMRAYNDACDGPCIQAIGMSPIFDLDAYRRANAPRSDPGTGERIEGVNLDDQKRWREPITDTDAYLEDLFNA